MQLTKNIAATSIVDSAFIVKIFSKKKGPEGPLVSKVDKSVVPDSYYLITNSSVTLSTSYFMMISVECEWRAGWY